MMTMDSDIDDMAMTTTRTMAMVQKITWHLHLCPCLCLRVFGATRVWCNTVSYFQHAFVFICFSVSAADMFELCGAQNMHSMHTMYV